METYTFDLARIFVGETPPLFLLEIVFRTLILFGYLIINLRFIGQRSVGQLSSFEIALIIALGSAAGDPLFYPEVPLIQGMLVITLLVVFSRVITTIGARSRQINTLLEGRTYRIVIDGYLDYEGVQRSILSRDEIYMEMRQLGILHLGMVKRAYLEPDGMISVFHYPNDRIKPGLPITPESDPQGAVIADMAHLICDRCGYYKPSPALITEICPNCHHDVWTHPVTTHDIELKLQ